MKVPPKRKGNIRPLQNLPILTIALNESPSEKEGKYHQVQQNADLNTTLNESPSEKEGKWGSRGFPGP